MNMKTNFAAPIEETIGLLFFQKIEADETFGKFAIKPLKQGLGTTIANSLRRTLLSCVEGWALYKIRFDVFGESDDTTILSSEFESIPGVKEDTIDIIARLKHLAWKVDSEERVCEKRYEFSGEKTVYSNDFTDNEVTVVDEEAPLFSCGKDTSFAITIVLQKGMGYVSSDQMPREDEYGQIMVDPLFSPVKNVKFTVSQTRVENRSDYEQLLFEVTTNGTVTPEDAIMAAVKVLILHFEAISGIPLGNQDTSSTSLEDINRQNILKNSVESLELSARALKCIKSIEVNTIGDLIEKTEAELAKTKNFGKKSLDEIIASLTELELSLKKEQNES